MNITRVGEVPDSTKLKQEDLDKLARSRKEEWGINREWVLGTFGWEGKGHLAIDYAVNDCGCRQRDAAGTRRRDARATSECAINCVATYSLQTPLFKRWPGLGDFDYLQSCTPYAHKYGIHVISCQRLEVPF